MRKLPRSDYFEATIQLRPFRENVFAFIQDQVKARNDVAIMKVERVRNGVDVYVTSQKFARALAKKLKNTFHGEVKMSYKLHTKDRQTWRDVYRATVLFRSS